MTPEMQGALQLIASSYTFVIMVSVLTAFGIAFLWGFSWFVLWAGKGAAIVLRKRYEDTKETFKAISLEEAKKGKVKP